MRQELHENNLNFYFEVRKMSSYFVWLQQSKPHRSGYRISSRASRFCNKNMTWVCSGLRLNSALKKRNYLFTWDFLCPSLQITTCPSWRTSWTSRWTPTSRRESSPKTKATPSRGSTAACNRIHLLQFPTRNRIGPAEVLQNTDYLQLFQYSKHSPNWTKGWDLLLL